jgi:Zn-dependent protease
MNDTLLTALALIPALVIAIVFHEVAHGWAALVLGDPTARERKRLTLNPIRHVDPVGTLILPGLLALASLPVFGWAKPVPVNKNRLHNPRFGMMAVAAAGPATNFLLALIGATIWGLAVVGRPEPESVAGQLATLSLLFVIQFNLFLGLFNLLPIPPFDGSHIVEGLLPQRAAATYRGFRRYGLALMIVLLLVIPYVFPHAGVIERVILPPFEWAFRLCLAFANWIAGLH